MNFLAHLYLSGDNHEIIIGNFIADGIVGKKYLQYPSTIQQGIQLHRAIDSFTDAHEIVRKSKCRLHARYKHYKGVIIDIFYDHYLAKNWQQYSEIPLDVYVNSIYTLLQQHHTVLPGKIQQLLPYMIQYNWLYNYQYKEGIAEILKGMNRRTKKQSQMDVAINDLIKFDSDFEKDFTLFFEDLRIFSSQKLSEINLTNHFT